jgi:flagellar secretion chaperone FliS
MRPTARKVGKCVLMKTLPALLRHPRLRKVPRMEFPAGENKYLVTEVFTAPPQKLQLMLIEAAIRLVGRARQQWHAQENGHACMSLLQAQEIVDAILGGMDRDAFPEVVDRVSAVYQFVARRLREANTERNDNKLQDVLRVLEVERDTWRQVCQQVGGQDHAEEPLGSGEVIGRPSPLHAAGLPGIALPEDMPVGGFSIEV